jgi:hypothetical protein
MSELQESDPNAKVHPDLAVRGSSHPVLEEYAGGSIQARVGYIPLWLLVTYAVLFVWALYYMVVFWGGVGPGRP